MFKYTTPTHIFDFPEDPSLYSEIEIVYSQNGKIVLEKNKNDMIFENNEEHHYGKVELTQEETSMFNSNWRASVQIRVLTEGNKCYASDDFSIDVKPVLKEKILGDENE